MFQGVVYSCPFFIKKKLYIYNMEHLNKVELQGKVLELQHENKLLRKQLNIQNGIYYAKDRN